MIGQAWGTSLVGVGAALVRVLADVAPRAAGAARFEVRGVTDEAAREIRVRIRSALASSGVAFDGHDVTVTFGDLPAGSDTAGLDLAVAVAVLRGLKKPVAFEADAVFVGEMSLSGAVRVVRGLYPRALAVAAGSLGSKLVVPAAGEREAGLCPNRADVRLVVGLRELLDSPGPGHEKRTAKTEPVEHVPHGREDLTGALGDAFDACMGEPRILLVGSPGSGKTMLARRIASMLPALEGEALGEVLAIYSASGILTGSGSTAPPFRAPHHTVSSAGMVGSWGRSRSGEVTLAHRGVLYLDEVTEFRRGVLDELASALRQGRLEPGGRFAAPARIVASANACPCGYVDVVDRLCRCTPDALREHEARLAQICALFGMKRVKLSEFTVATEVSR